jgi:hypothetical protein
MLQPSSSFKSFRVTPPQLRCEDYENKETRTPFSGSGLAVLIFLLSPLCPSKYSMENLSKTLGLENTCTILQQHPYIINLIFAITTILLVRLYFNPYSGTLVAGAPVVGAGSRYEPLFITRYRFTLGFASIISDNWRKVRIAQPAYINGANAASFWTNRSLSSGRMATLPFSPENASQNSGNCQWRSSM